MIIKTVTFVILLVVLFSCLSGCCENLLLPLMIEAMKVDQIFGNVPPLWEFDSVMKRDLANHFSSRKATKIDYELFSMVPSQVGVAFPKYYAWLKFYQGDEVIEEGAVRLAAMSQKEFYVTDYFDLEKIKTDPKSVAYTFPPKYVPLIYSKAEVPADIGRMAAEDVYLERAKTEARVNALIESRRSRKISSE